MRSRTFKLLFPTLAAGVAAIAIAAQPEPAHRIVAADEMVWGPAPASIPAGAQAIVLYGDTAKEGLFAMRLKVSKGYAIAPHVHPAPEIVTVLSGVVRLGLGSKVNAQTTRPLPAGSFYSTEPGTAHYLIIDEDAIIQVNSRGPWGISYLNPTDDPRGSR